MKRCSTCGVEKSLSEFYKRSDLKDGFANICKKCSVHNKERLEHLKSISKKTCNKCKQIKLLSSFIPDKRRSLGVGLICWDCHRSKKCRNCNLIKPLEEFDLSPRNADGRHSQCKICLHKKALHREQKRRVDDPTRTPMSVLSASKGSRAKNLWRDHKLTLNDYELLLTQQNGKCFICRATPGERGRTYLAVDHDHATNRIRGLLCDPCNRALGMFKDSVDNLNRAIEYLQKASIYQHFG